MNAGSFFLILILLLFLCFFLGYVFDYHPLISTICCIFIFIGCMIITNCYNKATNTLKYNPEENYVVVDTTYMMNVKRQNDKILYEYRDTTITYQLKPKDNEQVNY